MKEYSDPTPIIVLLIQRSNDVAEGGKGLYPCFWKFIDDRGGKLRILLHICAF